MISGIQFTRHFIEFDFGSRTKSKSSKLQEVRCDLLTCRLLHARFLSESRLHAGRGRHCY